MRELLINRLSLIKETEENFKGKLWETNFFSFTALDDRHTEQLSNIQFEALNDDDLLRLFEYILIYRND